MALTKVTGFGIGTIVDNVVMTSDDPTITMTDSSGTTDIATLVATSGALIVTARDGNADGEIIFKGDTGSAVTEHARIANTGLMTVISEGNAVQTSVQQGLAKMWYNGGLNDQSTADGFNVGSLTDTATGKLQINYTNDMGTANYSGSCMKQAQSTNNHCTEYMTNEATSSTRLELLENATLIDAANASAQVFGDLA